MLWITVWVLQRTIKKWSSRAELKLLIGLFQILLAMFLPLIVKGIKVPFSQITIEGLPLITTLAIVLGFGGMGLLLQHFNIKLRIKKS